MTNNTTSLIERYKTEYQRVNNRPPSVEVKGGWIRVDGNAYRRHEVFAMLKTLETRANFN